MRIRSRRSIGVALLAVAGIGTWAAWPADTPPPDWAGQYDVDAKAPEAITPGTTVGESAPEGWSHLVIKSLPRIRPSDRDKVNGIVNRYASWMVTVFTADVRKEGKWYRLRATGLGLGTAVKGKETIITPDTAEAHGAELGWITRPLLSKAHELQRSTMMPVHGPTFALVDCPVWFRCSDKNKLVRFRYALLVDAKSGRLDILVWGHDPASDCFGDWTAARLGADTKDEAELIPDPTEFTLGLPSAAAFAVDKLPPHQTSVVIPAELRPIASASRFTAYEARKLEAGLRALIP